MRILAILALIHLTFPARAELVDLELVLAVDVSGSVDDEEARLQRSGTVKALTDDRVIRAIRGGRHGKIAVTYAEWGGDHIQRTVVGWTVIDGKPAARDFARRLARAPHSVELWTSLSGIMRYALDLFAESPHRGKRRVLDLSGDGPNNDGAGVTGARDRALKAGIVINGLPIINGRVSRYGLPPMPNLDHYYEDCVIGGFGAFIIVANTYKDFARAIRRKLILEIAGLTPERRAPQRRPRLVPASSGVRPPCDMGEIIRDSREGF